MTCATEKGFMLRGIYKASKPCLVLQRPTITTMTDITAASAHDAIKGFADVNLPPYFTGNMSLNRGASKIFYRAGDKTEYIIL